MKLNSLGEVILSEQDIIEGLYSGKITDLTAVNIEDSAIVDKFNWAKQQNADHIPDLQVFKESTQTVEEFDRKNQQNWLMPEEYKNFEIGDWLYSRCSTDQERERVLQELELYAQHGMIDLLKYLKYLVDTMRSNNILWGVGRGSSVASYCLYLLGVHKINSLRYNLDIHEFLK